MNIWKILFYFLPSFIVVIVYQTAFFNWFESQKIFTTYKVKKKKKETQMKL